MTRVRHPETPRARAVAAPSAEREAPTREPLPIGPRVLDVLDVAWRARRPVLLEGPTGIGKSQIVTAFARRAGLDVLVLDLSLLEPPDLVGLPVIREGRTHYATPAELPSAGRGVLMLEELNRAEVPVMQPALQLLSARRLHAYELPPGWSCVAAVNPDDGDYQVNRLDPALRARFLQLPVRADRDSWLPWARESELHPAIVRTVTDHVDAFDHAPPRAWACASDVLVALRREECDQRDLVRALLAGYLPMPWAALVAETLSHAPPLPALDADALLTPDGAERFRAHVTPLVEARQTDAVVAAATALRTVLSRSLDAPRVTSRRITVEWLESLVAPLPGDLREQCLDAVARGPAAAALLAGLGVDVAQVVARGYAPSGAQALVAQWRERAWWHRGRMLVRGVRDALAALDEDARNALARDRSRRVGFALLASEMGPFGDELARWLSTQMPGEAPPRGAL